MEVNALDTQSCGPQLFPVGTPNADWAVDELGIYASKENELIAEGERLITPTYWRLGLALHYAKMSFSHGQWGKYLEKWGIDKTRAAKARAIYGSFEDEQAVHSLSVEQAYAQRKRKKLQRTAKTGPTTSPRDTLLHFAQRVCKEADQFIDEAAFADQHTACEMLGPIAEAIIRLTKLQQWLKEQADAKELG